MLRMQHGISGVFGNVVFVLDECTGQERGSRSQEVEKAEEEIRALGLANQACILDRRAALVGHASQRFQILRKEIWL